MYGASVPRDPATRFAVGSQRLEPWRLTTPSGAACVFPSGLTCSSMGLPDRPSYSNFSARRSRTNGVIGSLPEFPTVVLELSLQRKSMRLALVAATMAVLSLLTVAALVRFVVGVLTDERARPTRQLLDAGVAYVPNSAPLLARLASAAMEDGERDLIVVEGYAQRAVRISPWDYRRRLLLATVKEAKGERGAAVQSLQEALALAPNYTDVHWRLANLLMRDGKLAKSLDHYRAATSLKPSLLPATLDLLWRVSGSNLAVMEAVTKDDAKALITLAQFLLNQSRTAEAVKVFESIDVSSRLSLSESPAFINSLIAGGHLEEARQVWTDIVKGDTPTTLTQGVSNGSFEGEPLKGFEQFDWTIGRNDYAVARIDADAARTGGRSLRIDFLGRDTTRLDGQVRQMIVVRPSSRYRIECYVKSHGLSTPEGPRVVITDITSSTEIASSDPIASGSRDWEPVGFDFSAPPSARAVVITIKRVPKFSYDAPTRGAVWFDDFTMTEQGQKK